jgi:hypothetical protein
MIDLFHFAQVDAFVEVLRHKLLGRLVHPDLKFFEIFLISFLLHLMDDITIVGLFG